MAWQLKYPALSLLWLRSLLWHRSDPCPRCEREVVIFFFFLGVYLWHMEVPRLGGLIRATAATELCHSHSNARSKLHL